MAAVTVDGTVVEEEKVDLEIPQEKVDVKKADEAEPESAGGCDVCFVRCAPTLQRESSSRLRMR